MKKLALMHTLICCSVFVVTSSSGMDRSGELAQEASRNDRNQAMIQLQQSIRNRVETELRFTGNCKTDLTRIILYIHNLAEEYAPGSPAASHLVLMAQAALDRLDTCINQYPTAGASINPDGQVTYPRHQRHQFIVHHAGPDLSAILVSALTTLTHPS